MGIFSSKYKFQLDGKDWCVHMRTGLSGWKYTVTIDTETVSDVYQKSKNSVELLRGIKLNISDNGCEYILDISPVSAWDYGVHVYRGDELIYRHKDRDFTRFPRLEKLFSKIDNLEPIIVDDRPFWKQLLEGLVIGFGIGAAGAVIEAYLKARDIISPQSDFTSFIIVLAMVVVVFRPQKFRLIK